MAKDHAPLPEPAVTHMVFVIRGGPFGGKFREVNFMNGDRPRVGKRFMFALPEKVWKALTKGVGKPGFVEYEITKLPAARVAGEIINPATDAGEAIYVNPQGVLEL